jgi:hypothetical protein
MTTDTVKVEIIITKNVPVVRAFTLDANSVWQQDNSLLNAGKFRQIINTVVRGGHSRRAFVKGSSSEPLGASGSIVNE